MRQAAWRIAIFIGVGSAAALVHLLAVIVLVSQLGLAPLVANVLGWLLAFGVSFSGHWRLTFRARQAPLWRAARRFFGLSAAGFACNEAAYAVLLHWGGWRYDLALAVVLVAVAILTYLLSSRWAFRSRPAP